MTFSDTPENTGKRQSHSLSLLSINSLLCNLRNVGLTAVLHTKQSRVTQTGYSAAQSACQKHLLQGKHRDKVLNALSLTVWGKLASYGSVAKLDLELTAEWDMSGTGMPSIWLWKRLDNKGGTESPCHFWCFFVSLSPGWLWLQGQLLQRPAGQHQPLWFMSLTSGWPQAAWGRVMTSKRKPLN